MQENMVLYIVIAWSDMNFTDLREWSDKKSFLINKNAILS